MGMLIDGKWSTEWYGSDAKGSFVRNPTKFRGEVTADGSSGFKAEAGRYHLYVSYACPWAHRAILMRKLKGLETAITISVVDPYMGEDGWAFSDDPDAVPDTVNGCRFMREIYVKAVADYTGRVTVPVLWDKQSGKIVNNESREILRMLDVEFNAVAENPDVDLRPAGMAAQIDSVIDAIYKPINNGVYRAGFATTQEAYDEAVGELFAALDYWNDVLGKQPFLCKEGVTEADICLFTTLYRFDPVYYFHFKCNFRRIRDYPHLWRHTRRIYQMPGVRETCNMRHIKAHYYRSHPTVNPTRIVPIGPEIDYDEPWEGSM